MKQFQLFLLLIFLTNAIATNAQDVYFQHYQVEEGLSNNTVLCSIQDKRGFMWFGTKDGLNRFDGHTFKIFRSDSKVKRSLTSNSIWSLYEDPSGTLWVGTERGLFKYNEEQENFEMLENSRPEEIRDIRMDGRKNLWFISNQEICRYNYATKGVIRYSRAANESYIKLGVDNEGNLWASSLQGTIDLYDATKDKFIKYPVLDVSKKLITREIQRVIDSGLGYLIVGTSGQGVRKFDLKTKTATALFTHDENNKEIFVRDILKTSKTEIWLATESGIFIYDLNLGKLAHFTKNYNNPYSISDNAIYTLCKDRQGGIWAGSYFGGINYFSNQTFVKRKYFPSSENKAISGNAIREITGDAYGRLWIGSEDAGLNELNPVTGEFKHYTSEQKPNSLAYNNIHGLLIDNNHLWIGTFEHGLDIMDIRSKKIIQHFEYGMGEHDLKSNFIHSIYKTKEDTILIGTSNGLFAFDRYLNRFNLIKNVPHNAFYSTITQDHAGTIWVGTFASGVYFFNLKNGITGRLKIIKNKQNLLENSRLTYLFEDSDNYLWVATEAGLYKICFKTKKVIDFEGKLPSNLVYTIMQDSLKNIWLSTSKGLARIDHNTREIKFFLKSDGLLSEQFNYNSAYQNSRGYMYFGSVKGLIRFNPLDYTVSNYAAPIYITSMQLSNYPLQTDSGKSHLKKSITLTEKLTLNHNQSTFSFDFAALDFTSPDNIEYAYILEGLDDSWNYIKNNHRIYFTNLPPGSYKLRLKSTNSSGIWGATEKTLQIDILPPVWKTKTAYFIYAVIFCLFLYYLYRSIQKRNAEKQKREMEKFELHKERELYHSKIDFFTKIAHEIKTPLTLIRAPMEKLKNSQAGNLSIQKYVRIMDSNTQRLLKLTTELLDFRKIEYGNVSLNITLQNVTALTYNVWKDFEPIAEQKKIIFKFKKCNKDIQAHIDEESFIKILTNLLNNAIKFTKKKVVTEIYCIEVKRAVEIRVTSDGVVIPEEMRDKIFEPFYRSKDVAHISGTGLGLSLAKSLAQLQNGNLYLLPHPDGFNTFVLELPFNNILSHE